MNPLANVGGTLCNIGHVCSAPLSATGGKNATCIEVTSDRTSGLSCQQARHDLANDRAGFGIDVPPNHLTRVLIEDTAVAVGKNAVHCPCHGAAFHVAGNS